MGERQLGADTPVRMVPFSRQGIARRVLPLLPDDAGTIRHIICGQGFARWRQMIPIIGDFYVWPWHGFRIIAVTDDATYLLAASHWWRWQPKELLETLSRDYEFGPHFAAWPVRAGFTRLELGAETVWVPLQFKPDMLAADADLRSGMAHGRRADNAV